MSDLSQKLLEDIQKEYQDRLNSGKTKAQSVAFKNQLFIDKYHYNPRTLNQLLDELNDYGYIKKWKLPAFELIVD